VIVNRSLRQTAGALIHDWVPFELRLRGIGARKAQPEPWLQIRNREESIAMDERGVRCLWRFTSELHIGNVFPSMAARLMRKALARWPIAMRDAPAPMSGLPRLSFLIGHRGLERLPQLQATLRSIAGQTGVAFECIVVEQSVVPEIERFLPPWVRYIHTPLPRLNLPYCRSWAFNIGAKHVRGDVMVLHDNDMLVPERYAAESVGRIDGGAAFADLKRFIFYLDERDTETIFATNAPLDTVASTIIQNLQGGGSIVARRDAYEAIGGFDEEFVGWGGEDNEFFERAMVFGDVNRFAYLPILHLHHAPQPGKPSQSTAGIARYNAVQAIAPRERIARLRARERGMIEGPNIEPDAGGRS
jgi:Predicted glycosyltransferases